MVWKIGDLDIASSNQEGIVLASTIGATRLTAKAVSRDGQVEMHAYELKYYQQALRL